MLAISFLSRILAVTLAGFKALGNGNEVWILPKPGGIESIKTVNNVELVENPSVSIAATK